MNFTSTSTVPSVTQAVSLLTTPLIMTVSPSIIANVRNLLRANLLARLPSSGHIDLHFRLSPYVLPPPPILATCIASGVTWAEWIRALGGQAFDLYITNTTVSLKLFTHERPLTFWRAPELDNDTFIPPISKIQHREVGILSKRLLVRPSTPNAPVIQIPQLPSQKKPIGASKLSQSFNPFDIDSDLESDSSASSRPSSPSSDYSFSAYSDDDSLTSVSASSSPDELHPKTSFPAVIEPKTSIPVVNPTHKNVTNYLYQGGSTRVMTGGVMLGKSATANLKSKPAPVPRLAADRLSWRRRV